jgi:hypothetical protein
MKSLGKTMDLRLGCLIFSSFYVPMLRGEQGSGTVPRAFPVPI